jgi:hypothetical protein
VGLAFAWIAVFLYPTALGWAVLGGIRLFRVLSTRRSSAPVPGQSTAMPGQPVEWLGANLCRLRAKLEAAENETGFTLFKAARVRALRAAYLDVLSATCQRLEVSPPASSGTTAVPLTEIYRAEAALRGCGLDVRRPIPS